MSPRVTLVLLALICVLPVAASYFSYYVWPPTWQMNYGELLEPQPLPVAALSPIAGLPFARESLGGRWVLFYVGPAACDAACRQSLYYMRQVRTAQGKEMDRVDRLWVVNDAGVPAATALQEQEGMAVARGDAALLAHLNRSEGAAGHIYLMDPRGLVMLRYPAPPEPRRMVKDLERLLKYSQVG